MGEVMLIESLPEDLRLAGQFVALEALNSSHVAALNEVTSDGELWNLKVTTVPSPSAMANWVDEALKQRQAGHHFAFVVRRLADNKVVGCTRFYEINRKDRNLAIGHTWYAKSAQRTAINSESKLLLLEYAFATLDCISVAFHTDAQNKISQAAIARLGASKEGVLRNHRIMPDGRFRHTYCYSIIDSEWPEIKRTLAARLARGQ